MAPFPPLLSSAPTDSGGRAWRRPVLRAVGIVAAAAVLGAVFLAYLQPDMARTVAFKVWSCL